jgi:hypothetical protein
VFRCVLGSEGWVLVPRSSGTPAAAWAWPIWVVSRRRVLEVMFILLEFSSPSRRIFIGSHSLPPFWFAVSVLQRYNGFIIRKKKRLGRRKIISTPSTQVFYNPETVSFFVLSCSFKIESRDEIPLKGVGCDAPGF